MKACLLQKQKLVLYCRTGCWSSNLATLSYANNFYLVVALSPFKTAARVSTITLSINVDGFESQLSIAMSCLLRFCLWIIVRAVHILPFLLHSQHYGTRYLSLWASRQRLQKFLKNGLLLHHFSGND